jgi:CheY-like chemotaxis protein
MTTASDLRPLPATQDPPVERAAETAHDFNNLLGVIIANLDLLADELKAAPGASHLIEEAMTAAIRGSGLARDLLRATRGSAAETGAATPPRARETPPSPGNRELVLVVDDNAPLRHAVVQELAALGYRTLEAGDGPAALMILNGQPVDLLFTDVVMPGGMSGFDLARLVLARWPAMKALITSAFPELEPTADSITAGKLRRLIKPYRKDDLAVALREVLAD